MNADNLLFRCSSLGYIMIEPNSRSKNKDIADGTVTHLVDLFVSQRYGRREEAHSKQIEKGNAREQDSITLISRIEKTEFKKNSVRLSNEYIQGEPDMFLGEEIMNATQLRDAKTSWSAHTFFLARMEKLSRNYFWQMMGYLALTGAPIGYVDYCLVNGTAEAIQLEKFYASRRYGPDADAHPEYIEECRQIERNHIFDLSAFVKEYQHFDFHSNLAEWKWDIPLQERHFSFEVKRDEEEIQRMYQRVRDCRQWMNAHLFKTHSLVA